MKFKYAPIPTPKDWEEMEFHPWANIFDIDDGVDVQGMANHMSEYGYDDKEPIVVYKGKIISGRHRRNAAKIAGIIEPPFVEYIGDDIMAILKKDLLRRHPSPSQLSMAGARLLAVQDQYEKEKKKNPLDDEIPFGKESLGDEPPPIGGPVEAKPATRAQIAKTLNVSERSIDRATVVEKKGIFALKRLVRTGEITVSDAEAIATLSKKEQAKAIEKFAKGKTKTVKEAALPKTEKKKKSTVGKEVVNWKDIDATLGKVARIPDEAARAFAKPGDDPKKKGPYHKECIRHLESFFTTFRKWRDENLHK